MLELDPARPWDAAEQRATAERLRDLERACEELSSLLFEFCRLDQWNEVADAYKAVVQRAGIADKAGSKS